MTNQVEQDSVFRVTGGATLSGEFVPQGNKNEALPVLAAACLTDEPVSFENLPAVADVRVMQQVLQFLGIRVESRDGACNVQVASDPKSDLPSDLCAQLRGSVTLAGPLLARVGRVFLPRPGGDRIGRRRLDTHILALQTLGAEVEVRADGFELRARQLAGADVLLDEASVTATENAVCAAVLARGQTILRNAACEPHVQGLCRMLVRMGAKIEGIGSNTLHIQGVERLRGTRHCIGPDYLEIASLISLAAVTGGEVLIKGVNLEDLRMILQVYGRLGIQVISHQSSVISHQSSVISNQSSVISNQSSVISNQSSVISNQSSDLLVPKGQSLKIANDLGEAVPKVDDAPWPGFPADCTSVALVTATQCRGTILIHEKMYESRLFFVDSLIGMGARIILCDPHRAVVMGPAKLHGARLNSPDIRAGITMLIAAMCAEGESVIQNIGQIDRGFERIDDRLRNLGANIERVNRRSPTAQGEKQKPES